MILTRFLLVCLFLVSLNSPLQGIIDLDEMAQDFILETKQLHIPGYPDAFNPSIMRWDNSLLLSFRTRDPLTKSTDQMGFIWLDDEFNPIGDPYLLDRQNENLTYPSWAQDPRLITIRGFPHIVYNNMMMVGASETRRMIVSPLHFDGINFFTNTYEKLMHFEGENNKVLEKNWVPFEYAGQLLLSYSINPHQVMKPLFGSHRCEIVHYTKGSCDWSWGTLRGGTMALRDGDKYLAFFHSVKSLSTIQSNGKKLDHYFMGAYTFSLQPPFQLLSISPEPLISKTFYNGPMYNTWKPLRVVFPCGFVFDDSTIWIAYGRQDHECWIVKINKQALLDSLIPVY